MVKTLLQMLHIEGKVKRLLKLSTMMTKLAIVASSLVWTLYAVIFKALIELPWSPPSPP